MTQETIELKLKMTLEKLEEAGFDITRTANDMKFQENIEDYEEIYNSLSSHIECLKGINRLKVIERKIETSDVLGLVKDIIEVIRIFRNNKETLKEKKPASSSFSKVIFNFNSIVSCVIYTPAFQQVL